MRFVSLASGSAGNAAFIGTETTRLLVDVGLSVKTLATRMAQIQERPDSLTGIVISHSHTDHVSGLVKLVKHAMKTQGRAIPVYMPERTAAEIDWEGFECPPVHLFKPGETFAIGDIGISSLTVPHDAPQPLAFTFTAGGIKVGIAVDLGFVPDAMRARFRGAHALLVESNHDSEMLSAGPYIQKIKTRVAGDLGHLSNLQLCEFIRRDMDPTVQHLALGHLSKANNSQLLTSSGARDALRSRGMAGKLSIAPQDSVLEILTDAR